MEQIIDAKNLIVGRLCTYAAKRALLGDTIKIINSEKAVITGTKDSIVSKFKIRTARGNPFKGPFISRLPDRLLRRMIRGMLPYKRYKGIIAFKRIMCYIGTPESLKDKKAITLKEAHITKAKATRFLTLAQVSKLIK